MIPFIRSTVLNEPTQFPLFELPLDDGLLSSVIEELDREVEVGILTKRVKMESDGQHVYKYYDRRSNQVAHITAYGYWSLRSYTNADLPLHYQNSQGTWYHYNYDSAGEIVSFADAMGTWTVVDATPPFVSRNQFNGCWRIGMSKERIGTALTYVFQELYARKSYAAIDLICGGMLPAKKEKSNNTIIFRSICRNLWRLIR